MRLPVEYNEARRALAAVTRIVEAKTIRGKAIAMEVFAYQAKDVDLMGKATEVRKRAERRIGELIQQARETGTLAKGTRGKGRPKIGGSREDPPKQHSLAAQGVDKHLADRARKSAAMTEAKFEASVTKAIRIAVAAIEKTAEIIRAARVERHEQKRAQRKKRERKMGE